MVFFNATKYIMILSITLHRPMGNDCSMHTCVVLHEYVAFTVSACVLLS